MDVVRCNGQDIGEAGMLLSALVFPLQCVVLQRDNNMGCEIRLRDKVAAGREKGENLLGGSYK